MSSRILSVLLWSHCHRQKKAEVDRRRSRRSSLNTNKQTAQQDFCLAFFAYKCNFFIYFSFHCLCIYVCVCVCLCVLVNGFTPLPFVFYAPLFLLGFWNTFFFFLLLLHLNESNSVAPFPFHVALSPHGTLSCTFAAPVEHFNICQVLVNGA